MAFDQPTRNRLQKFVADSRALLTEEFTRQLQHEYGMNPVTGEVAELSKLPRLDDGRRQTARLLRETLEHYLATSPGNDRRATVERIVREQAFTVLNRLCALRMAESRDLLIESVGQGAQSKGFQLYARLAGPALGERGDAYRCYLFSLFDEFAMDLAVLFDRFSPSGRLFPRESALLQLLEQINHPDLEALWAEDETIGWIYQYFNSKDERKKMRDDSAAPRNSRELAVRNQFFTPRYVVEFLTDNTLGRIWYEMTQGQTSLKESCRYLVRRPNEIFLKEGEQPPAQAESNATDGLSQEELLNQPVHIPHRALKDPREIKMIDPACGSMHFGLYAFDLFERIYEEAWHLEEIGDQLARDYGWSADPSPIAVPESVRLRREAQVACFASGRKMRAEEAVLVLARYQDGSIAGRPLIYHPSQVVSRQSFSVVLPLVEFDYQRAMREQWFAASTGCLFLELARCFDYETRPSPTREEAYAAFRRDVPRLIIEHNIHGIDIDPRAVQIAGLSLWLRAQKSWQEQGLKPQARPQIRRSNIACAEPMPGETAFLEEFIAQHLSGNPERQFLAGLVRRVFESMKLAGEAGSLLKIEEEIADEVAKAKRQWLERPAPKQLTLFGSDPKPVQQALDLTRGITDASFWDEAEALLYDALRAYAESADQGGYQRRLFANDAARGFAFVDLCRARYDVALMNPPFGDGSLPSKPYIDETYGDTKGDVYKAFVECFHARLIPAGYLGIISSRTGFFLGQSEDWRTRVVLRLFRPIALADLGSGVLDAMVEVAAYVLRSLSVKEARDLTLSLVPVLEKVVRDKQDRFSLPKWQAARGGLKRHQAVAELEVLECNGFLLRTAGEIVRYLTLWQHVRKAALPPKPVFPHLVCVKALNAPDKGELIALAFHTPGSPHAYICDPSTFAAIPSTTFAYWAPARVNQLFKNLPHVEHGGRIGRLGVNTTDDFRFLRLYWEIATAAVRRWTSIFKGGGFRPFFNPSPLMMDWEGGGRILKALIEGKGDSPSRNIRSEAHQGRHGLTYSSRTQKGLGFQPLPSESLFTVKGPAILANDTEELLALLAIMNSLPFRFLVSLQMAFGSFEIGVIQRTPLPIFTSTDLRKLGLLANTMWQLKRFLDSMEATSHAFFLPSLLVTTGVRLIDRAATWVARYRAEEHTIDAVQAEIDQLAFQLYGLDAADRAALTSTFTQGFTGHTDSEPSEDDEEVAAVDTAALVTDLLEYALGCSFGRWDIRFATGEYLAPPVPDPFAALPHCPSGMLQNEQKLPLTEDDQARLHGKGDFHYPLDIPWNGLLVDDAGHPRDIEAGVQKVFQILWPDTHEAIEHEACEILGVKSLREFFRKPADFFAFHLKQYSKSRRQAPIYWPLSTTSNSYTLWIYYHRLTDQTLYIAVNDFVEPKLKQVAADAGRLKQKTGRSSADEKELEQLTDLEQELNEFRSELLRIAAFWKPNLNDGVQITAAPLWKLFRLAKWQKTLKETWLALEAGDYDWAHLAYSIWPDRVAEKCKTDKSLAIAHNLEHLFVEVPKPAKKRATRKKKAEDELEDVEADA